MLDFPFIANQMKAKFLVFFAALATIALALRMRQEAEGKILRDQAQIEEESFHWIDGFTEYLEQHKIALFGLCFLIVLWVAIAITR